MSEPGRGKPQSLTETATLNAVTSLGARVSGMVVGIALTPFVLHGLGRELYGISAAAGSVLEYLWLLRGGLGTGMRRFVTVHFHAGETDLARRYYTAGFWWASVLRLAVVVLGVALARVLCTYLNVSPNLFTDATGGLVLLFLGAGITDVGTIFEIPIYATGHTSRISLIRIAGAFLRVGFVVPAFLLFVPSLRVFAAAVLLAELCGTLLVAFAASREKVVPTIVPRPDFGTPEIRRALFTLSGFGVLSQVASILYLATDNLLIGGLYGPARVTEYSLGTRWAPMIQGFLWAGVSALTPLLTQMEARGDLERTRGVVIRATRIITAVAVPMCLVPCVLGDVFLARWVGAEYAHCVQYMIAMLVPLLVGTPLEPSWMAMMASGRLGRIAASDVIAAVSKPAVGLLLALPLGLGPLGFALGNTAAILFKNLLLRPMLNRGDASLPPIRSSLAALLPAVAGGAPALALLYFTKPWYGHSLATVLVAGVLGGVLCLAGSTLAAVGVADTRRLAGSLVSRLRRKA